MPKGVKRQKWAFKRILKDGCRDSLVLWGEMTNTGLQKSVNPIIKVDTQNNDKAGGAVRPKSDKAVVDTKKELAKGAGVSHDTITKVQKK